MVGARREASDDRRIAPPRPARRRRRFSGTARREMPPEQENVASRPPGRNSFSASRLMSLYARAAFSMCRAVGANFGGSSTIRSKLLALSRSLRNSANTSASRHAQRVPSSPFCATFSRACASASAELSIDSTDLCAAGQRRDGEAAGIAKAVQHVASLARARGCDGDSRAGRERSRSSGRRRHRRRSCRPSSTQASRAAGRTP